MYYTFLGARGREGEAVAAAHGVEAPLPEPRGCEGVRAPPNVRPEGRVGGPQGPQPPPQVPRAPRLGVGVLRHSEGGQEGVRRKFNG